MEKEFKIKEVKVEVPDGYEIDKENSTFECIKFKPIVKELPKTWEEYCRTHPRRRGEAWYDTDNARINIINENSSYINSPRNVTGDIDLFPNREYVDAMLALCQLIQLRDCYNDSWVPDWNNSNDKYVICIGHDTITASAACFVQHILVFKSKELCTKFLNNFRDLIEVAKPLL